MAVKLFLENAIGRAGTVLKNGTGGSAPDLDENPDWPTRWSLIRDRAMSWRAFPGGFGPHGGTYQFDYDFGSSVSIAAAGFLNLRFYPPSITPGTVVIQAYHGASYPPPTNVSLNLSAAASDNLKEFTPASDRYWRVEIQAVDVDSNPMEISGRPWLVETANIVTLDSPTPGSTILSERVRDDVETPAGAAFHLEPAIQVRGSQAREVSLVYRIDDGPMVAQARDTFAARRERFVIQDYESAYMETTLPDGEVSWERLVLSNSRLQLRLAAAP